ncbi:MAG TPA: hypothetical protein VMT89_03430 [Candidatus Acidoferrales bacterium]|nr:hypothetical protein [Candidatus Acidoferrales bacterium]
MLHAEIRWSGDALHFVGEADGYNLQTLRHHMMEALREKGPVAVNIELSERDLPLFERQTRGWMSQLKEHGARVVVTVERKLAAGTAVH